jgi:hypothetical protein
MRITRKNFLKGGATAIAACIGLAETRCSDDDAPPAQSPGGTGGVSGSAGAQGSTGSGVCSNLDADIETDHPHDLVIPTPISCRAPPGATG